MGKREKQKKKRKVTKFEEQNAKAKGKKEYLKK